MNRTVLWIGGVLAAAAAGWMAAMTVEAGAPLGDEQEAYVRFRNALEKRDVLERTEILVKLIDHLSAETLPGAVRAYREDLYPLDAVDLRILIAYWAKVAPREMLQEVGGWVDTRAQRLAAGQAVIAIADTEGYAAARALYDEMPTHQQDAALPNLVIGHIDHGELKDLAGFITGFPNPDDRETVANIAVHRMIRQYGPEVVQTWVESLPPGRGSSSDLKRVAFRSAQSAHLDNGQRDAFIAWLERVGNVSWTKGAWRSIAVHWVRRDPIAAIEWARSLPEEDGREDVVAEAIRIWSVREAEAAHQGIVAQPPSAELDRGTGRLAVHYALSAPETSFDMMERLISQQTFDNARRSVEHRWNLLPGDRRESLLARSRELARSRRAGREAARGEDPAAGNGAG